MDAQRLRENLRARMVAKGFSAKQLSMKAGLGPTYVRDYLAGKSSSPRVENLTSIAHALEFTLTELYEGTGETEHEYLRDAPRDLQYLSDVIQQTHIQQKRSAHLSHIILSYLIDFIDRKEDNDVKSADVMHSTEIIGLLFLDLDRLLPQNIYVTVALKAFLETYLMFLINVPASEADRLRAEWRHRIGRLVKEEYEGHSGDLP